MIEEIDSLQKIKILFFAKPHVGLVRHVEGVNIEEAKKRISKILKDLQINQYKIVEEVDESEKRVDVVAFFKYKGSELKLWMTVTEKSDVGCVIEIKIYHKMEESAEADEYLSIFSGKMDLEIARV